ncbi:MAG: hypothetical protein AB1489_13955 [Acidobacteriota bacterium]
MFGWWTDWCLGFLAGSLATVLSKNLITVIGNRMKTTRAALKSENKESPTFSPPYFPSIPTEISVSQSKQTIPSTGVINPASPTKKQTYFSKLNIHNPYLAELNSLTLLLKTEVFSNKNVGKMRMRVDEYNQRFTYAVPSDDLILKIAEHSPLVQFGAGNGYLAYLLRQMDVDIIAFDIEPTVTDQWTTVIDAKESIVTKYSNRVLLLCWPFATFNLKDTVERYGGHTIIYVGPSCSSPITVFSTVFDRHWVLAEHLVLPQWPGSSVTDVIRVYRRKEASSVCIPTSDPPRKRRRSEARDLASVAA